MSLRESITQALVQAISEIEEPRPVLVTREPYLVEQLAITQFPAVMITAIREDRQTITLGAPGAGRRQGTITVDIRAHLRGVELDRQRNNMIEALEEQIERDRYLGLRSQGVLDSQIRTIEIVDRQQPLAEVRIELEVRYNYLRGTV